MQETVIKIENLKKQYRLGTIGGGTLRADLQSWWARKHGKEDPNTKIGMDMSIVGDTFYALDGINLEVHKGEALGIIGANGAGKSTLLKLLSRVTAPTEGTIKMNGRIASMLEVGTGFHPELTGRENIYMNGAILGMTKTEIDTKIEDIIDFSECRQFIDTPVKRYSSGMYVKLAFAVAAHLDAEIMIMDEVLAVGDVKFQQKCLGKMGDATGREGKTVLYVSHNMSTIRQLCDRCVVLSHGRIAYDGNVEIAIDNYLGTTEGELIKYYDFANVKRPSLDHGNRLFVHSFSFEGRDVPKYRNGERIQFSFEYTSFDNDKLMAVYFTILADDDCPVGTFVSKIIDVTEENKRRKKELEIVIKDMIPGIYHFYFDVCYTNDYGRINSCDHPLQPIYFEILDDGSIDMVNWNKNYWGHIHMGEILEH